MAIVAPEMTVFAALTQSGVATLDTNLVLAGSGALIYGGIAGGTANALEITIPLELTDYYIGMMLTFVAGVNNTAPATAEVINPNGTLPPIQITDLAGTALTANAMVAGAAYVTVLVQNSSNALSLRIVNGSGGGGGGAVSSVFGRTGAIVAQTGDYAIGQIAGAGNLAAQNANSVAISGGTIGTGSLSSTNFSTISASTIQSGTKPMPANYSAVAVFTINGAVWGFPLFNFT